MNNYNNDFYAWTQDQAKLMRDGNLSAIDIKNIAEEIESMGKQQVQTLTNRLAILLMHLLKWQYQKRFRGNSWKYTIAEQRKRIVKLLKNNPSLQSQINEIYTDAYEYATLKAAKETGISVEVFPKTCPYNFSNTLKEDFYPED